MSLPATLIEQLSKGNVIPLVGAGVSMSIKDTSGSRVFPSWPELLNNAATVVGKENGDGARTLISSLVEANELHTAAEMAKKRIPTATWYGFLKSQFDHDLNTLDTESSKLQQSIWSISNRIITLNYDKCLKWAHKLQASVDCFDNTNITNLRDFKVNNTRNDMVWHLHGQIEHPENIILTPESYKRLYSENSEQVYKAALKTLQEVFSSNSILFVGCSMSDAELLNEMQKENVIFAENTGPHYAIVKEADKDIIKLKLESISAPIEIITFEDFGQPLVDLINDIAKHSQKNTPARPTVNEESTSEPDIITVLTSNPLDRSNNLEPFIKSINKIKCDMVFKPLNHETIWEDTDYLLIFTNWTNNGFEIEDDASCRIFIEPGELFSSFSDKTKGVFIFVDSIPKKSDIEQLKSSCEIPILITTLDKNNQKDIKELDKFYHQIFKRNNLEYLENSIIINRNLFNLSISAPKLAKKTILNESKLHGIEKSSISNFIGRNSDLSSISRELYRIEDENLALMIKGSGGIGKTTIIKKLAIELAKRNKYDGGIYFIDCEPISDYNQFYEKLSYSFDLQSVINLSEHLSNSYDYSKKLIILDNFESILNIDHQKENNKDRYLALIAELVEYATIVITSRESCGEDWEEEYILRSLESDEALELFNKYTKDKYKTESKQKYIKEKIIEELLDRNPLAIKLISSNIPPGKDIYELEQDLKQQFSDVNSLDYFNTNEDENINRKNSLLGSVIYSYKTLKDADKKALELISFFPDGITLSTLKKISENHNSKSQNIITDNSIKTLSNKSLILDSTKIIKQHSIINRFIYSKANSNKDNASYWESIIKYNIPLMEFIGDLNSELDKEQLSLDIFMSNFNNLSLIIDNVDKLNLENIDKFDLVNYIDSISVFSTFLNLSYSVAEKLCNFLEKCENNTISLTTEIIDCIKTVTYSSYYFSGNFEYAFKNIKEVVPIETIRSKEIFNDFEMMSTSNALDIYSMEGFSTDELNFLLKFKRSKIRSYPTCFYEQCIFNDELLSSSLKNLSYYETHRILNSLDKDELRTTLNDMHVNMHIERCQLSFILHTVEPLSNKEISKLVSVNPFTSGLKDLMLAINIEKELLNNNQLHSIEKISQIEELYASSLRKLYHIKYFYLFSQYYYSRFSKNFLSEEKYSNIIMKALNLAKKFGYPYWIYNLENLTENHVLSYNTMVEENPINSEIEVFVNDALKYRKKRNKNKKARR